MRSHKRGAITILVILLSLSLSLAVAGNRVTQAASTTMIDYVAKLNELVTKGSDESLNAEPFYRKASALCVGSPPIVDVWSWPTDWSREQQSSVKNWVKANANALAHLRLGTQRPSYWFQFQGRTVWEMDRVSYLGTVRLLVFALTDQTKSEATEGNTERAVEDVLTGCRFALDVRRRLFLMEQLVGIAASNYALDTGFQIVGRCSLDPSLLKRLQDRLTELSKDPMWLVDLRGEEIATLDAVQEIYAHAHDSRDNKDMGIAMKIFEFGLWVDRKENWEFPLTAEQVRLSVSGRTLDELAGLVREGYAYCGSVVSKTPFQWKKDAIDADQNWRASVGGNMLLCVLAPAVARVSELSFRMRASRDALITTLALLRHKRDKGAFPADLQELVPAGYMTEVPMDPYNDKPLVYKPEGHNFVLYSVGTDFKDNGGKHDRRWGESAEGGDYVFWPVRTGPAKE